MKFICQGQELNDAVLKVCKAAAARTTNPILECVKLTAQDDTLTLMCTDLELTIIKTIKADVKMEGSCVIPAKFLSEFVKKIGAEQITFTKIDNAIEILYGENHGLIQCQNADEFPMPKEINEPQVFNVKANDLKDLAMKASVAVAQDDSRPMLRGILLEIVGDELRGVALDGVRMAIISKKLNKVEQDFGIVITARALLEIVKLIPEDDTTISIQIQENHLKIDLGDTIFITRLLGYKKDFVNYEQIIQKTFKTSIVVNREQLYNAIERASLLSWTERNHIIKLSIKGNNLTLNSSTDQGNITENMQIEHDSNDIVIHFNGRFLIDCLHVIGDEFIKINFCGEMGPAQIVPNEDKNDYFYLVLPMRP